MGITTIQGVIENGQIKLNEPVNLPEKKIVYVIIPDFDGKTVKQVLSPRLVNSKQAKDFIKKVEEIPDAQI
jgi:predicted DNA-binding antitoxin AbrB/MazE fold protein